MALSGTPSGPTLPPAASALERLPHICEKICVLWDQPEFEPFIHRLIMDSRDGTRQGFPWEAALEMLFLAELAMAKRALTAAELTGMPFAQIYQKFQAQSEISKADPWSDPGASREASRVARHDRPRPAVTAPSAPRKKKSWWRRLFG